MITRNASQVLRRRYYVSGAASQVVRLVCDASSATLYLRRLTRPPIRFRYRRINTADVLYVCRHNTIRHREVSNVISGRRRKQEPRAEAPGAPHRGIRDGGGGDRGGETHDR